VDAVAGREGGVTMRHILLIHGDESGWERLSEAERAAQYERYVKLNREMEEHGQYVAGEQLAPGPTGKLVRVRQGETVVSDGPFAETKEQLGGFYLLDCDLDTALAYAARIPAAEGGTVEVRSIVETPDG
jgi:hypothetical protein